MGPSQHNTIQKFNVLNIKPPSFSEELEPKNLPDWYLPYLLWYMVENF